MFSRFGLLADWIVDHRWMTLLLVIAMTVFTFIGHYDPYLILPEPALKPHQFDQPSAGSNQPVREPPRNVTPVRVASGDVIVVAESEQFFTQDGADAIRDAVSALEDLDLVDQVFWMDRAPMMNIFGLPEPILPRGIASQKRFDQARQRALDHPLVAGQLLSRDAKTLLLMVEIDWFFVTQDSDCTDKLRDTAAAAVARYPNVNMNFAVTGNVPIRIGRAASNRENQIKYQIIGFGTALIIAFVLFRGLSSVFIVALAPAAGVFWTLGVLHYLGYSDNPFNSVIVPVLLCMVGFTDGVHMMVQIRRHRAEGMPPRDAARTAIREVGLACWLTSLTTAVGFGSLALAHHEVVREFGYCCVIGVLLTFVSVITIIPLACSSPLGRRVHSGHGKNLIDHNLARIVGIVDLVMRRAKLLCWVGVLATFVLSLFTLQLRPDERLTSNLSLGNEAAQALKRIDMQFGGMETSHVEVNWQPDVEDGSGEIATVIAAAEEALREEPLIGNPLSIATLSAALPGQGDPKSRMSLLELLPPPLKRAYYTPEYRHARVTFRLQDLGIAKYGPVFERIEKRLDAIHQQHPNFILRLSGNAVWRWKDLYRIVVDLAFSLGTASVIIFCVLTIVYRSLRLGLISIIPNMFPLAMTGFLLLISGQYLEIVSVCAFTVCLGIAVDDTIHFLTRYQEEHKRTPDRREAVRNAFAGVGTALIMTTIVLTIGFSVALTSDARDHRIFAMMGILTFCSALFGDLIFLPALLLRHAPVTEEERAASEESVAAL